MACLSDIDLATLHKTRLEEKIQYKLSWLRTRHSVGIQQQKPSTHYDSKRSTSVVKLISSTSVDSAGINGNSVIPIQAIISAKATDVEVVAAKEKELMKNNQNYCDSNNQRQTIKINKENYTKKKNHVKNDLNGNHQNSSSDEQYFSSETSRRRRSGTWP